MANYSVGEIAITIYIEDTFVVEISNAGRTWNFVTEIKTTNCSKVTELYLQRIYEDARDSFKWTKHFLLIDSKLLQVEFCVFNGDLRSWCS